MMASGKFFLVALGSLLLYTLFIHFGYLNFMEDNSNMFNVYLYDPNGVYTEVSPLVLPVASEEELDEALAGDTGGIGIRVKDGKPNIVLYAGTEKVDRHRADYALSLLHSGIGYQPETVGDNTVEMKLRREITCELLFIEIVAVGFLGIASVLFKEKQMGVIRVHAIMPLSKSLFVFSKVFLFLLTDLIFAALMTLFNVGPKEAGGILPAVLIQTGILSLIMALTGFGCTMLLKDFKQFSLAYLVIALFVATPVFLSANTAIKIDWIYYHPFYHVYMGLKNAFFGTPVTNPVYYICIVCVIILLFGIATAAFRKEMGKEG
ncbi:MAG: ABC transporter permease [Lachnospiraceae bacterium]|nr:ABC transporter permease [Lachnospiraceae bacterium]